MPEQLLPEIGKPALHPTRKIRNMGAQIAKEHHLVPKFWLRAFAEEGHLTGLHRDGREHRTPVKRAAKARNFNTDPLVQGMQRVALETYLAEKVDHYAAPVMRAVRSGTWPLATEHLQVLRRTLAWQLVRTQMFRSWNAQVGAHLAPVVWAHEIISLYQRRLGRMLTDQEGISVFWDAYHRAPDPQLFNDDRWHLRAPIQGLSFAMDYLGAPERHLVLMQAQAPCLILGDTGVVIRRTSGTYSIAPPLFGAATELFAPVSPTHLLISTRRPERYQDGVLTAALARQANKGAVAWCQNAVYRLTSMRSPRYLRLAPEPPVIPAPRIAAAPSTGREQGNGASRPVLQDPELLALLSQFSAPT
ncbi:MULTISPECIES: DUF4238 domain-containing protein [unclassified Streptomyces]|uniref:DUF4238 domain-containing protein n=1 Tax=unclassified Streptomyces TaxID=2593676 RepID=UPI00344C21B4